MKKILLILIFSILIYSKDIESYNWKTYIEIANNFDKIKPYDIVLLNKGKEIFQKWGHVFLVDKDKMFIEFKGYDEDFVSSPFFTFSGTDRKFLVLRYENINEELEKEIEKLIPKYYNKRYNILTSNDNETYYTYCSKFVCNIFEEGLKNLNDKDSKIFNLDKWPIYPFDFLKLDKLKIVEI